MLSSGLNRAHDRPRRPSAVDAIVATRRQRVPITSARCFARSASLRFSAHLLEALGDAAHEWRRPILTACRTRPQWHDRERESDSRVVLRYSECCQKRTLPSLSASMIALEIMDRTVSASAPRGLAVRVVYRLWSTR